MKLKKITAIVTSLIFACAILVAPCVAQEQVPQEYYFEFLEGVLELLADNYHFEADTGELWRNVAKVAYEQQKVDLDSGIEAIMSSLDRHSEYLDPTEYSMLQNDIAGNFCGIGVSVSDLSGRIVVVEPLDGSPAHVAGIMANDVLISVDGVPLADKRLDDAVSMILGEEGTSVTVGVLRNTSELEFTLVRAKIENPQVEYEILPDSIGYISMRSFSLNAPQEVEQALQVFDQHGITDVIIDLRNNPGGDIRSCIAMAQLFIPAGEVIHVEAKNPANRGVYSSALENAKYKLAILVNEYSASASELFAGGVQDTGVGIVVGTHTYGKGTVQAIFPLINNGAIKLTIGEYTTVANRKVDFHGLTPDIELRNKRKYVDKDAFLPLNIESTAVLGDSGEVVTAIQQRLAALGFYKGDPNGVFDDKTESAVKVFQIVNNLPSTGEVDFYTTFMLIGTDYDIMVVEDLQKQAAIDHFTLNRLQNP